MRDQSNLDAADTNDPAPQTPVIPRRGSPAEAMAPVATAPVIARIPSLTAQQPVQEPELTVRGSGRLFSSAFSLKLLAGAGVVLFLIAVCGFLYDKKDKPEAATDSASTAKEPFKRDSAPTAPTAPRFNAMSSDANWQAGPQAGATSTATPTSLRVEIPANDPTSLSSAAPAPRAPASVAGPGASTPGASLAGDLGVDSPVDWQTQPYPNTDHRQPPAASWNGRSGIAADMAPARNEYRRPESVALPARRVSYDEPTRGAARAVAPRDDQSAATSRPEPINPADYIPRPRYAPAGAVPDYRAAAPVNAPAESRNDYRTATRPAPAAEPREYEARSYEPRNNDVRGTDTRSYEPRNYEARGADTRGYEPRNYDTRGADTRGYEPRNYDMRGTDSRGYEPRNYDTRGTDTRDYRRDTYPAATPAQPAAASPQAAAGWPATQGSWPPASQPQYAAGAGYAPVAGEGAQTDVSRRQTIPSTSYDRNRPSLY